MPASPEVIAARKARGIQVVEKSCRSCAKVKVASEFRVNWRSPDGLNHYCRDCVSSADILRHRGISEVVYHDILSQQGGVCAICRQPERTVANNGQRVKRLAVDHDHSSGVVRGLLCANCNKGIGNLGDSPERLIAAAAYIVAARGGE